jgi:hypothetical protein
VVDVDCETRQAKAPIGKLKYHEPAFMKKQIASAASQANSCVRGLSLNSGTANVHSSRGSM